MLENDTMPTVERIPIIVITTRSSIIVKAELLLSLEGCFKPLRERERACFFVNLFCSIHNAFSIF